MKLSRLVPALLLVFAVLVCPVQGQSTDDGSKIGGGVAFDGGTTVTVPILLSYFSVFRPTRTPAHLSVRETVHPAEGEGS